VAYGADGAPHCLKNGDFLYAHWMWTPPSLPGTPRGDSREAIRLVSRPSQWFDSVQAKYSFGGVSENGSSQLFIELTPLDRVPASARVVARLADGRLYALERGVNRFEVWAPVEPSRPDFEVLGCGVELPLEGVPTVPDDPVGPDYLTWTFLIVGITATAAGLWLVWRALGPKRT